MRIKKLAALAAVVIIGLAWYYRQPADLRPPVLQSPPGPRSGPPAAGAIPAAERDASDPLAKAYAERARGRMITARGTVARLLPDDREGSPHQRFVVRTASGLTVLVSHNLDLAQRLEGLRVGDAISLYGEYEWNDQGGVMHWTHNDPDGQHVTGYIDWNGRRYQ